MSDEQLVPLFSGAARSEMHRGGVVLFNATAQGYNRRSSDQNTSMKPHASQEHYSTIPWKAALTMVACSSCRPPLFKRRASDVVKQHVLLSWLSEIPGLVW
jgi:hypothetical protein